MKTLLFLLTFLFIGTEVSNVVAQTAPSQKALSSSTPSEFQFNQTTSQYNKLGFGDYETLFRFTKSTIGFVTVFIEDEHGNIDYNTNAPPYKFSRESETFEEFVARATALQLQHAINVAHFPKDRQLKLSCSFKSGVFYTSGSITQTNYITQLFADNVPFVPQISNGTYIVPQEVLDSLSLQMDAGGRHPIPCARIKSAALELYDGNKLVYKGDTLVSNSPSSPYLTVMANYALLIARSFLTNGYTGTLTIRNPEGYRVYRLIDGKMLPIMSILYKDGQITITVKGPPFQNLRLFRHDDLNLPPTEEENVLFFDEVGSVTWTNEITSSAGIFSVSLPSLEESKQSIKR